MNRSSTRSWGLLGSAKHWAKVWELGIDKEQRDVGDAACGPALRKGERKVSGAGLRGHVAEPHSSQGPQLLHLTLKPAAWPTHHTEQSPFFEGRMESDALGLGSWLSLDDAARGRRNNKRQLEAEGMWQWRKAGEEPRSNGLPSTYQGSSSNTGLLRVQKRRMTGLPSWTRGFPGRNGCRKESRGRIPGQGQRATARVWTPVRWLEPEHRPASPPLTFHEHSQTLPTGVPDHGVSLSPKSVGQNSRLGGFSRASHIPLSPPPPLRSPFLSMRCLYCGLGQICHNRC